MKSDNKISCNMSQLNNILRIEYGDALLIQSKND